jgi:hypothetical protein
MVARTRREVFLDRGPVFIEAPRLMTDEELADVLEEFVKEVRARPKPPAPEPPPVPPEPSNLPFKRKPPKRWR